MLVKCQDLLPIIYKRGGKLLGGENGLSNVVSWCYVVVCKELEECLRGGEIVFVPRIPGDDGDVSALFDFLRIVHKCNASAICVMVGSDQIQDMPEGLAELADKLAIPLFEISWDEWLVDWTYEIGNFLFTCKNIDIERKMILQDILYGHISDLQLFNERLTLIHHNFSVSHVLMVMDISYPVSLKDEMRYKVNTIGEILCNYFTNAMFMPQGTRLIFFIPCEETIDLVENCGNMIEILKKSNPECHFRIGIGSKVVGIKHYKNSYDQAQKMLELLRTRLMEDGVADYAKLGIHYMVLSQNRDKDIVDYCMEKIGDLIQNDTIKDSELTHTFEVYFYNKYNLAKTAEGLFIHRNTLLHRLETIESILGSSLTDSMICLDIMNTILLYNFVSRGK